MVRRRLSSCPRIVTLYAMGVAIAVLSVGCSSDDVSAPSTITDAGTTTQTDAGVNQDVQQAESDALIEAAPAADVITAVQDSGATDGSGTADQETGSNDFASVRPIFARCTSCHAPSLTEAGTVASLGGLDLVTNGPYVALYNVVAGFCADRKYVNPGHPETSYLINAVSGDFPAESATCTNNDVDGGKPMIRMPAGCNPAGGANPCLPIRFSSSRLGLLAEHSLSTAPCKKVPSPRPRHPQATRRDESAG